MSGSLLLLCLQTNVENGCTVTASPAETGPVSSGKTIKQFAAFIELRTPDPW
jgi:hypothetical protein